MVARARMAFVRFTSCEMAAAPGTRSPEGTMVDSTTPTSVTCPSLGADSRPTNARARLAGGRSVEADDDLAYTLPPSDNEHSALGATDDPSRHATHEQSAHGAMTAPAEHDHIGLEALRFAEDSLHGCLVYNFDLDVGPASRQGPPCARRRHFGAAIERAQENRAPVFRPSPPRNDDPDACPGGPGKMHGGRERRLGLARSVCRHQDAKLCVSAHIVVLRCVTPQCEPLSTIDCTPIACQGESYRADRYDAAKSAATFFSHPPRPVASVQDVTDEQFVRRMTPLTQIRL